MKKKITFVSDKKVAPKLSMNCVEGLRVKSEVEVVMFKGGEEKEFKTFKEAFSYMLKKSKEVGEMMWFVYEHTFKEVYVLKFGLIFTYIEKIAVLKLRQKEFEILESANEYEKSEVYKYLDKKLKKYTKSSKSYKKPIL